MSTLNLSFRATPEEKAKLIKEAEKLGITLADLLRSKIYSKIETPSEPKAEPEQKIKLFANKQKENNEFYHDISEDDDDFDCTEYSEESLILMNRHPCPESN